MVDQELIFHIAIATRFVLLLVLLGTMLFKSKKPGSNSDEICSIVLQVNTHRLTESDFRFDVIISRCRLPASRPSACDVTTVPDPQYIRACLMEYLIFIALYICCVFRIQPDDIGAHINVGRTLNSLQLCDEAEQAYRTALALLPPVKPGRTKQNRRTVLHSHYCLPLNQV